MHVRRQIDRAAPDTPTASEDRGWWRDAACNGAPQEGIFFTGSSAPRSSDRHDAELKLVGRVMCWGVCGVRETCLAEALRSKVEYGVWGGHTSLERRRMRLDP